MIPVSSSIWRGRYRNPGPSSTSGGNLVARFFAVVAPAHLRVPRAPPQRHAFFRVQVVWSARHDLRPPEVDAVLPSQRSPNTTAIHMPGYQCESDPERARVIPLPGHDLPPGRLPGTRGARRRHRAGPGRRRHRRGLPAGRARAPPWASRLSAPAPAWPRREPRSAPPPTRPRPGSPSASLGPSPWPPPSAWPSARPGPGSRFPCGGRRARRGLAGPGWLGTVLAELAGADAA